MKKNITLLFLLFSCLVLSKASAQTLCLNLKTDKITGETFTLRIQANPGTVKVDWGDGIQTSYTVEAVFDSSPTIINKVLTIDKPTIKVYGKLINLFVNDQKLTTLDFVSTQWSMLRRLDIYNNFLTSFVFPAEAGIGLNLGTINAYNNNFDVCAVEALYNSLFDRSGSTVIGSLFLTGNGTTAGGGEGNIAQNTAVKDQSRISLATARNWKICDSELAYADALANPIPESPTAIGCVSTDVERSLSNKEISCYYDASKKTVNVKIQQQPGNLDLMVYNAMGKTCYSETLRNNEAVINTSRFSKGIYIVKVSNYIQKVLLN